MHHRRFQRLAKPDHLPLGPFATGPRIDRDAPAFVEECGDLVKFGIARADDRARDVHAVGGAFFHLEGAEVTGHDQDRHAALGKRRLGRQGCQPAGFRGIDKNLAKNAAALIDRQEVHLLRKVDPQLVGVHLAGDQDHRGTVPMALKNAVDEVEAARAATSGTGGEIAGHVGFGAGGKGPGLFMAHVDPGDIAAANGIRDMVQCVADYAVTAFHPCFLQGLDNDFRNLSFRHGIPPLVTDRMMGEAVLLLVKNGPWPRMRPEFGYYLSAYDIFDTFSIKETRAVFSSFRPAVRFAWAARELP